MKNALVILLCTLLCANFCCTKKSGVIVLKENQSLASLLIKQRGKNNVLLFLKNNGCSVCTEFYGYVNRNYKTSIESKLPENTIVVETTINDFSNQNMWLFHILEGYSFPTMLLIDKEMNIKSLGKGGDLYAFDSFLNKIKPALIESFKPNQSELKKYSLELQGYLTISEGKSLPAELYIKIGTEINKKKPTFISALLEASYYKQNKIYPNRVAFIKKLLFGSLNGSNNYFLSEKNIISAL